MRRTSRTEGKSMVRNWMWVAWTLNVTRVWRKSHPARRPPLSDSGGTVTSTEERVA